MNAPRSDQQMLADELRAIAATLQDAIGNIIEAHTGEDGTFKSNAFSEALCIVNSARICLRCEADKLESAAGERDLAVLRAASERAGAR